MTSGKSRKEKQGHLLIETVLTVQKTSVQLPEAPEVKEQQKWMTVTMTGNVKVEDTEAIPGQMHRMIDGDQILAGQDPEELRQEAGSVVRILMTGTWKQMMKRRLLRSPLLTMLMMEEMNKWLSAHKQLCVITGIFGLLVSPFLWPVFLAVIIQSLSLVIPVAAGLFFYEKFIMKKDKEETNENDDDNKQQKKHADARKVHADAEKTEDLPKNHEKGSETVNFDNQEKQARCRAQAAIWYENEGFERIQAIRKTLESENRNRFSVNREGICSISIGKRKYRRVGILKGYPFGQTEVIREKLKKDGFITSMGCNNYLWISW